MKNDRILIAQSLYDAGLLMNEEYMPSRRSFLLRDPHGEVPANAVEDHTFTTRGFLAVLVHVATK